MCSYQMCGDIYISLFGNTNPLCRREQSDLSRRINEFYECNNLGILCTPYNDIGGAVNSDSRFLSFLALDTALASILSPNTDNP